MNKGEYLINNEQVMNQSEILGQRCPACHKLLRRADDMRIMHFGAIHEDCLKYTPFAITMEHRSFAGLHFKVYGLYFSPEEDFCIELTGNEAKSIIKEFNLTKYVDSNDGKLWSDELFRDKYKGYFARKERHYLDIKVKSSAKYRENKRKLNATV